MVRLINVEHTIHHPWTGSIECDGSRDKLWKEDLLHSPFSREIHLFYFPHNIID